MKPRWWFVMITWSTLTSSLQAEDWPQFLGPRRDGTSKETGLVASWPKDGPPLIWEKEIGSGFSGPVIAGQRVLLFHRVGDEEVVECFTLAKGEREWRFAYATEFDDSFGKGNGPRATPTIAGKRVITFGADGWLHCLDLENGKKLWKKNLLKEYRGDLGYFGVGSSPLVEEDLVLVNVGGKEAGIVALNLADGEEKWKATKDAASYASPIAGTIGGARQAIFFTRNGVVTLDPKTGTVHHKQRWRARIDASVNAATPLLIGDLAFFSASYDTGGLLLRLKKDGADEVWTSEDAMANHYNTCIHHDGYLFGFDGRQEVGPSFRCVELKTKKVEWEQKKFGCGSMILAEGKLLILTENGNLILAEATPKKYEELARVRILDAGPVRAQIALADGKLFARDQKRLVCLRITK